MDQLEAALDAAQAKHQNSIWWDDAETNQRVEILCTYGRYLVDYLNNELTMPIESRWNGH